MPPPSNSPLLPRLGKADTQPTVSAAHFLRGASGFGAVVFREYPGLPTAQARLAAGHGDCLSLPVGPHRGASAMPAGVRQEERGS